MAKSSFTSNPERYFSGMFSMFTRLFYSLSINTAFAAVLVLFSAPYSLLSAPSWMIGDEVSDPGDLGSGGISVAKNPVAPGCGTNSSESVGEISKVEFDESSGDVNIIFQFFGGPENYRYSLQSVDSNRYPDDSSWKTLDTFSAPDGMSEEVSMVDGSYLVGAHRYYRVVGENEDEDVLFVSNVEGVMQHQVYEVTEHEEGYSTVYYDPYKKMIPAYLRNYSDEFEYSREYIPYAKSYASVGNGRFSVTDNAINRFDKNTWMDVEGVYECADVLYPWNILMCKFIKGHSEYDFFLVYL